MEKRINKTGDVKTKDVVITHIFSAPRELVFNAWTDPRYLPRWYAPPGCVIRFQHLDIKPGGSYLSCISNPSFGDCWATGVYIEITPPERVVYTTDVADETGKRVEAATVGMDPEWPSKTVVTVTFEEMPAGKTKVTLHQTAPELVAKRTGAHPSWIQMMDRLNQMITQLA